MCENTSIDSRVLDVVLDVIANDTEGFNHQFARASLNEYGADIKKFIDVISRESIDRLRSELNDDEFGHVEHLVSYAVKSNIYLIPDNKRDEIVIRYC